MIEVFDKKYKAISNLFVETYTSNSYTFPSPIEINAKIGNDTKKTKNEMKMVFSSYLDSILIVPYYFDLFFYCLSFEYKIDTILLRNILLVDYRQELNGYKAEYRFLSDDITINFGDTEIYDNYRKDEKTTI